MEYEKHAKLVTAIKESGDSVSLLVVDPATDDFFQSCDVTPGEAHLAGPLPTPKPAKKGEELVFCGRSVAVRAAGVAAQVEIQVKVCVCARCQVGVAFSNG